MNLPNLSPPVKRTVNKSLKSRGIQPSDACEECLFNCRYYPSYLRKICRYYCTIAVCT